MCQRAVGIEWLVALLAVALFVAAMLLLAPLLKRRPGIARSESALAERVVRWHGPRTIALFGDLSAAGAPAPVALVAVGAALLFIGRGDWQAALSVALAPALAGPLGTLLKRLTRRTRPRDPLDVFFGSSMPSSHTLMATALYGTLAIEVLARLPAGDALRPIVVALAAGVIGVVGASRVLLRVHHPSDVVVGWLLGALIVAAVVLRPGVSC